jgi:hypothetical protein
MTIAQIYTQYQIPPNLQRHQLEVTAVGQYICDHWIGVSIDKKLVTETLLLHDMGNIIKFKRPFLSEELRDSLHNWEKIQDDFIQKYGKNVHTATMHIAKELQVSDKTYEMISMLDGEYLAKHGYSCDELYISNYADMTVSPEGIVGYEKRAEDLKERYGQENIDQHGARRQMNREYVEVRVDTDLSNLRMIDFSQEIEQLRSFEF